MSGCILIADDDRAMRVVMERALRNDGHETMTTGRAETLWNWIEQGRGDAVIADVIMPDGNGLELLPRINRRRPGLPVVVVSAHSTLMTAVRATQGGAYDYLAKPFDIRALCATVARALNDPQPQSPEDETREEAPLIIGQSPVMQGVFRAIGRLAPTDLTVLIEGESGSGKEMVARALHELGHRRTGPFVAANMAAIPRDLIESELFGHERGAFTGASQSREGLFSQACGGTLFLDEIGDMPPEVQTRLLRVLQDHVFTPLGSHRAIPADVRIIAATHRDLAGLLRRGRFREDLFHRLNVVPVQVPPLRERRQDIPFLVQHFLSTSREDGLPAKTMDYEAIRVLQDHAWPGNVRELENLVRRLAVMCPSDPITQDDVIPELVHAAAGAATGNGDLAGLIEGHLRDYFRNHGDDLPASGLYERMLKELERPLLSLTLDATAGNQLRAAEVLGLNRNTLRKKLRDLEIAAIRGQGAVQ